MTAREKWSIFDSFFSETYSVPSRVASFPNSQERGGFALFSKVQTRNDELFRCLDPGLPLINFLGDSVPLVLESFLLLHVSLYSVFLKRSPLLDVLRPHFQHGGGCFLYQQAILIHQHSVQKFRLILILPTGGHSMRFHKLRAQSYKTAFPLQTSVESPGVTNWL